MCEWRATPGRRLFILVLVLGLCLAAGTWVRTWHQSLHWPGSPAGKPAAIIAIDFSVPGASDPIMKSLTMRNTGRATISRFWFWRDGMPDFRTPRTIVANVTERTRDAREIALGLWKLVRDYRYHWVSAENSNEAAYPPRMFCVYGYGWCHETAICLAELATAAGLPARVWGIGTPGRGHAVTEVHFDGNWHILDADNEVFYLKRGTDQLASVADVIADPSLITGTPPPAPAEAASPEAAASMYGAVQKRKEPAVFEPRYTPWPTMGLQLKPGEEVHFGWQNGGVFHGNYQMTGERESRRKDHPGREPPVYANGHLRYRPAITVETLERDVTFAQHVQCSSSGGPGWELAQAGRGIVAFDFKCPYVMVQARVDLVYSLGRASDALRVFVSDERRRLSYRAPAGSCGAGGAGFFAEPRPRLWQQVWEDTRPGSHEQTIDLGLLFTDGQGADPWARHQYFVLIELLGADRPGVRLTDVSFDTTFQAAPRALPRLLAGRNRLFVAADRKQSLAGFKTTLTRGARETVLTMGNRCLDVRCVFEEGRRPGPRLGLVSPRDRARTSDSPMFAWRAESPSAVARYHIEISPRSDFLYPVTSGADRDVAQPQFQMEKGWLLPGRRYYWRVKAWDKDGIEGRSRAYSFRVRR